MATEEFEGIADVMGGGLPESKVTASSTALMIVDVQYVDAHRDYGIGAAGKARGLAGEMEYYFSRLETLAIPDRKSTRLNSSHIQKSRMPSSA